MKPGYMLGIIACCLFMTIEQMAATTCLKEFKGGSSETNPLINVTLSSQYEGYGPDNCLDGNIYTFCHTKDEKNPYFMIEYASPTKINEVKVTARQVYYWRAEEVVVIVTDTKPTKGQLALEKLWRDDGRCGESYPLPSGKPGQCDPTANANEKGPCCSSGGWCGNSDAHCKCSSCVRSYAGTQLGSTFHGFATRGGQVITFKSEGGVTGKYVIVQQHYEGVMNLAEVEINPEIYQKMLKNVYTNCIENPECGGCGSFVKKHLPNLLQKNMIKEGEIGVNNGSLSYPSAYLKQWATTLTLRKVGDIKTIKTDNEMVTINGTVSATVGGKRWYGRMKSRPTGLYAGKGDLITLTFPEDLIGKVGIDIGHHNSRFILSFDVKASVVKVGSPFGGLIIVWMNYRHAYTGEFTISVTNAIKAPCFVYGKTTNDQWEEMRHYSPKWSVLRVLGQVEIFVQTLKIKDITDMDATMSRIKNTMDLLEESVGLPAGSKPGAELLHFDAGLGGGFHVNVGGTCQPGVTVCGDSLYTEDEVNNYTYYDSFFKQDGLNGVVLHELGHAFCLGTQWPPAKVPNGFPDMGAQWTAETVASYITYTKGKMDKNYVVPANMADMVDKNLDFWMLERMVGFSMYSGGKPCGLKIKFNRELFDTNDYVRCWKWLNYFPERAHGWHIWKDVNTLAAKSTKSYNTWTDRMVDLYCKATKHNMLPMFNWYNIKPSDEAITNNCQKLPESDLITKWVNVAKCVKQSMTSGDKDIRECGKMPRFPEHKGLCVISGVCNKDVANNGNPTTMNKKFDLYGSTGQRRRSNFAEKETFPELSTTEKKETCFKRAEDFSWACKNRDFIPGGIWHQPVTATFYAMEQGNEFNYTFPHIPKGNCYYDSPRLLPKHEGSTATMIPKECNKMCKEASYSYFGVQYYNECWCGNQAPAIDQKKDLNECDTMCKGDTNLRCGGGTKINIWKVCSDENCEFKYE